MFPLLRILFLGLSNRFLTSRHSPHKNLRTFQRGHMSVACCVDSYGSETVVPNQPFSEKKGSSGLATLYMMGIVKSTCMSYNSPLLLTLTHVTFTRFLCL